MHVCMYIYKYFLLYTCFLFYKQRFDKQHQVMQNMQEIKAKLSKTLILNSAKKPRKKQV